MPLLIRRSLPFIIVIVFFALAAVLVASKEQPKVEPKVATVPIIEVAEVKLRNIHFNINSYGTVKPKIQTQLVAEVSGRLVEVSDNFVAGAMVQKGDILARLEPADYQADLMQAQASLAQAKARLEEEIAQGQVAKENWRGVTSQVPTELALRKPQLKQEQANVKFAEAALARAQRNLERTIIRAPFDGLVKARSVDLGQFINTGVNLGRLYDTRIAEIRLPLTSDELAYLESMSNPDTSVTLTTELAGLERQWNAKITRSEGVIDEENRMVYLVADLQDPYLRLNPNSHEAPLKFGSFVTAQIKGRPLNNVAIVPRHLVKKGRIATINGNNEVEFKNVRVARADLDSIYIDEGLQNGDRIAKTVLNVMEDGMKVEVLGESQPEAQSKSTQIAAKGTQ
ncbi:efflux RND transporter periplasmic adaptor subunit [Paraferrimonas haliotis]|uniref:RND superfamily efflux pump MFP component n=1 Tax=Paraferrimonas haliotis TaxID=2013866 RepID=A0AA37WW17_9GAMM|nr:efflux RND transporter periplasmic adaptor subunit [Paraferrimonas haliotis]GLS83073.1 RND superfamily efflux pump MFP component [Paraferrimonas haliotis]